MHTRARPGSNDEGETLLELMIAVAIMGIAVVAVVGGVATTLLMSDIHRKQATAGAYVRNYAEAVVAYVATDTAASNANFGAGSPDYSPSQVLAPTLSWVSFTAPNLGFDPPVISVKCWDGVGFSGCPTASAVHQVKLSVTSTDKRAAESLFVVVRRP